MQKKNDSTSPLSPYGYTLTLVIKNNYATNI